jgi:hypothetical protein
MTDYLNNSNRTTLLFKKFQNKIQAGIDTGTGVTTFFNESKNSLNNIYNTDIFIENIERNLPDEYKLSSLDACGNIPGSIWKTDISDQDYSSSSFLIPDTNLIFYKEIYLNSVSGTNNAWWLIPPGSDVITDNNLLKDMIPFNFNSLSLSTFSPIIKYWDGNDWISEDQNIEDGLNWLIDYSSGILQFYQDDSVLNNSRNIDYDLDKQYNRPRISFIKYVGKKGLENLSLEGDGATTVIGTYPNFTISSTDTNTTYSAGNGITLSGTQFNIGQDEATNHNVTFNRINTNDSFIVNGLQHGIIWEIYGGGWHMQEYAWMRNIGGKSLSIESNQTIAAHFKAHIARGTPSMYKCMKLDCPIGFWGIYINNAGSNAIRGPSSERSGDLIFTFGEDTYYDEYERGGYYLDSDWKGGDGIDFTGQHRSLSNKNLTSDYYGLIVVSSGKYINLNNSLKPTINESLCIVELCKENNSKNVYGVLSNKEDSDEELRIYKTGGLGQKMKKSNINDDRIIINSLGEGAVWVSNKNGNLINGDYITGSSLIGYGMKQNEDILYNFTVAKITCDCDFNLTKKPKQKIKQIKREKIIKKYSK